MKFDSKLIQLKNGQTVELRPATPHDAEKMLEHLIISHSESYKNLNQTAEFWKKMSVADEQNILANYENSKSNFVLIAIADNIIRGGLGLFGEQADFVQHNARIGMSIQKAFANTGLGTEMMKYAIELASKAGFHRIYLTVRTYNTAGIALYEKVGFKRIGLLKDAAKIDGQYVDEYSYELILG